MLVHFSDWDNNEFCHSTRHYFLRRAYRSGNVELQIVARRQGIEIDVVNIEMSDFEAALLGRRLVQIASEKGAQGEIRFL